MGYRSSWIAVKEGSLNEVLTCCECEDSLESVNEPDLGIFSTTISKDGVSWSTIIADGSEYFGSLSEEQACHLSRDGRSAIFFLCSDTVMATELISYQSGELEWSISFGDHTDCIPIFKGNIPVFVHEIHNKLESEKENPDDIGTIYDITAEVGRQILGFRHDDLPESSYKVLQSTRQKRPFWQFWR